MQTRKQRKQKGKGEMQGDEELDSVAARNYFSDFKLPLVTVPLKQI